MAAANPVATPNTALQLDNQLCFALYSTSLAMTKLYTPLLADVGLTYPQYLVMLALWQTNDVSVTALGELLFLNSGTLTPLLKRMEAGGWLLRQRDQQDERRVQVRLTPAGVALNAKVARIPRCVAGATGCTLAELQALTQQVQDLRARLQVFNPLP